MMKHVRTRRGALAALMLGAMGVLAVTALGAAQTAHNTAHNNEFVQRDGTRLTLSDADFRHSGPNIEWLGIATKYRVIAYNADGNASDPSAER